MNRTHATKIEDPFLKRLKSWEVRLCGGDGLAGAGTALAGVEADVLATGDGLGLLDDLLALGEDELDVAGVGHVGVNLQCVSSSTFCCWSLSFSFKRIGSGGRTYATVGTVCASPLLGGLVDLDVLDDEVAGVEALGVGVGLGVLEEAEEELGGLDGPAGLGDAEGLALGGAADGAGVAAEGDSLLLLGDVLEEGDGALELPAVDGLGGLTGVLEGHTEVGTARAGRLRGGDLLSGVANLNL